MKLHAACHISDDLGIDGSITGVPTLLTPAIDDQESQWLAV
jgi:hypothetical protein